MRRPRPIATGTLALALVLASGARITAARPATLQAQSPVTPVVSLRAASGATIRFKTNNGEMVEGVLPEAQDVPLLVLYRNDSLTEARERTLILEVAGIAVPPGGMTVTVDIETQHGDPDLAAGDPIPVSREVRRIPGAGGGSQTEASLVLTHTFGASVTVDGEAEVPTPTDYFRYTVSIATVEDDGSVAEHQLKSEHALLLENQRLLRLPKVREATEGAAPDTLVVYYCDMFPFRKSPSLLGYNSVSLPRRQVPDYVRTELIPEMTDAFRAQTDEWGFAWHDEWTSYRIGEMAERLSVALTDGETWYHGSAPVTGHSGISLNTSAGDEFAPYDTLTAALASTFRHELFHNLQRSISQHLGGDGSVDADGETWKFFSEGTALLASTVGLPEARHSRIESAQRDISNTNGQVDQDGAASGSVSGPHGSFYWRFLYEQCGGMKDGVEDPAAGMVVVRNALAALYSGEVVDITSSTNFLSNYREVMDRALAQTPSCPFGTFEESLADFASAH